MGFDFLDVEPDAVDSGGRTVLNSAADWRTWASGAETKLRNVPAALHDGRIALAWDGYAGDAIQANHALAGMVETLGTNARSGAATVADADADATGQLSWAAGGVMGLAERIARPADWTGRDGSSALAFPTTDG
jgi:hypothetical protein